ncbi:CD3324 family protein [Abyssisolibacter fermentans]|uniref:CD3324 family protein n=1 Tax=Abyssisolibacter fermentans TaxID=1766203 RepID=UPI00082B0D26|nr:CD3324 family protein [Abyssisolibacter fermentans]
MNYKNGKDILPNELLMELQRYIQGEIIYIPKQKNKHAAWGENNGTRKALKVRNKEIYKLYKSGQRINEIMKMYNLSEASIRKIIVNEK